MFYRNDLFLKKMMTQQMNENLRQAEKDRLLAELDAQRPNRLFQVIRGALHALGHLLLAIGQRLDHVEAPKTQVQVGHAAAGK